jgi:hypothetical protein
MIVWSEIGERFMRVTRLERVIISGPGHGTKMKSNPVQEKALNLALSGTYQLKQ